MSDVHDDPKDLIDRDKAYEKLEQIDWEMSIGGEPLLERCKVQEMLYQLPGAAPSVLPPPPTPREMQMNLRMVQMLEALEAIRDEVAAGHPSLDRIRVILQDVADAATERMKFSTGGASVPSRPQDEKYSLLRGDFTLDGPVPSRPAPACPTNHTTTKLPEMQYVILPAPWSDVQPTYKFCPDCGENLSDAPASRPAPEGESDG